MTDRALLFLVSFLAFIGAIAAAAWLIATWQIGTFDGNFLLLSSLTVALAFGLYLKYMVKMATAAAAPKIEKKAPEAADKKPAPAAEPVGKL